MNERLYAFISAADRRGPMWEIYARRLGPLLVAGLALGAALYALIEALPAAGRLAAGGVLALAAVASAVRQIRWVRRRQRQIDAERRKLLAMIAAERDPR